MDDIKDKNLKKILKLMLHECFDIRKPFSYFYNLFTEIYKWNIKFINNIIKIKYKYNNLNY